MTNGKVKESDVIIAPVEEWTWMAIKEVRSKMIERNIEHEWLSDDFFKVVVLNIIEDALCDRLLWTKSSGRLEKYLDSNAWFTTGHVFSDTLYETIDTVLVPRITDMINLFIPKKSWYSWGLRRINSNNFYIIERGDDYRILEYYRLKGTYEPDNSDRDLSFITNQVSDGNESGIFDFDLEVERLSEYRSLMLKLYDEMDVENG